MARRTCCLECLHNMHAEDSYDSDAECDRCGEALSTFIIPTSAAPFIADLRRAIFKDVMRRRESSYVAHSEIVVKTFNFPEELLEHWLEQATATGRATDDPWDREAPRTQWANMDEPSFKKAWLFTTFGAVGFICSFDRLRSADPGGVAWLNFRQLSSGDILVAVPPMEVTLTKQEVEKDVFVTCTTVKFSTGIISFRLGTNLRFSAKHPSHTHPASEHCLFSRWRHLPFYDDWTVYCRWKTRSALLAAKAKLLPKTRATLVASVKKTSWGATGPPAVVASRLPGPADSLAKQAVPWQHPKLLPRNCGYKTIGERLLTLERAAAREAAQEKEQEEYAKRREIQYAKYCYTEGKLITLRALSKGGRVEEHLAKTYGYNKDLDPRFNGDHEQAGYEGVGPDPCDPLNRRTWLLNFPRTWQQFDQEQERERKQKRNR